MTTFYGPVQNRTTLGWKYCASNSRGGHPLGTCGDHDDHPSAEEAQECFNAWARDNIVLRKNALLNWCDCGVKGCPEPAKNGVEVPFVEILFSPLCNKHSSREGALSALRIEEPPA